MSVTEIRANEAQRKFDTQEVRELLRQYKTKSMFEVISAIAESSFDGVEMPPPDIFKGLYLNATVMLKEWGSVVVGFAIVTERNNQPFLEMIAVDPKYRGCGVGRQITEAVISRAMWDKKQHINLVCKIDNPAQKMYFDAGFRVVDVKERYYLDEGDGLMMQRVI